MKTFLALSLLSLSAFATDRNSSWEEIRKSNRYETNESQINFSGTFVSVFHVCHINETELRTLKPVTVYAWIGDNYEPVGEDYKYASINYDRVVVVGDGTVEEPATYSLNHNVRVTLAVNEGIGQFQFTKPYTIPACK